MRTFVAIDITPAIRKRLTEFIDQVRPAFANARWVRPEGMHITLKFLGEISADQREQVEAALSRIRSRPIKLRIGGLGFFPAQRSPRVFWVGIRADDSLARLASAVDEALSPLGFEPAKKPYTPHLTLARFNPERSQPAASSNPALERGDGEFGGMTAAEYYLFESRLSPKGSTYTKLARFALH